MKKLLSFIILATMIFIVACEAPEPSQPELTTPTIPQALARKIVAVGNSLTMGIQSAGIVEDFQMHSYPYFIAKQMNQAAAYQQPLIGAPGLGEGGRGPMKFVNGTIVPGDPSPADPRSIAKNLLLSRPYDNLGVSGADLNDVLNTTNGGLFDLVLRNPNFGNMTQIDQALSLNPSIILLWIGNNDVLGAALSGTAVVGQTITPTDEFRSKFTQLMDKIANNSRARVVLGNIPNVTDIPYVNTMDIIFRPIERLGITQPVPVLVDQTFQPIVFDTTGGPLYLPLLTTETNVAHVLLPALTAYQSGMGVPDSAALVGMGLPAPMASVIVSGLIGQGINPTGTPLPPEMTLTADESATIANAVAELNGVILEMAQKYQAPVVDANTLLNEVNNGNVAGISGRFVLMAPANTAFSLDGVHPNNAGYALVANEFIKVLNASFGLNIPQLDATAYTGQYVSENPQGVAPGAFEQVRKMFSRTR